MDLIFLMVSYVGRAWLKITHDIISDHNVHFLTLSYSEHYPNKGKSNCAQIAPNMTVAGDSDDQLQVSNQSSSASENEDVTKPVTSGSATTKMFVINTCPE